MSPLVNSQTSINKTRGIVRISKKETQSTMVHLKKQNGNKCTERKDIVNLLATELKKKKTTPQQINTP